MKLYKRPTPLSISLCAYMYSPFVPRQLLRENVTAATNALAAKEEMLCASLPMLLLSYRMKGCD
jgi:hypothetical protein